MIYAGETVRVNAQGDDWDDTPLSPAQTDEVTVDITDGNGLLVESGTMVWLPQDTRWVYDWNTPTVAGSYSIEVTFWIQGQTAVDVRRVTLDAPRPTPALRQPLFVRS